MYNECIIPKEYYMSQGLPLREDVPVSETWDLVDLFKDDQQYLKVLTL